MIFDRKQQLIHPFDICLNPLIMCKEGWCVGLGQKGVALLWGNCLKYLKRGCNRKWVRENKTFKNRGKLGALKRGGLEPPYKL